MTVVYSTFINTPMGFKTVYVLPGIGSEFGYRLIQAGYICVSGIYMINSIFTNNKDQMTGSCLRNASKTVAVAKPFKKDSEATVRV